MEEALPHLSFWGGNGVRLDFVALPKCRAGPEQRKYWAGGDLCYWSAHLVCEKRDRQVRRRPKAAPFESAGRLLRWLQQSIQAGRSASQKPGKGFPVAL